MQAVGGAYGTGKRISLPYTRELIRAAIKGDLSKAPMEKDPLFGFQFPSAYKEIPGEILNPSNAWKDADA